MEFVCYTDWEQLPASADTLFARGEKNSLFFSRRWYENLAANALDDDLHLLLACVVDGDSVLAILPLRTHHNGNWHALNSYYTSLYTLLLSHVNQQAILDCMAEGLGHLAFQSLRLEPVAQDDPTLDKLQQAMEDCGFESHRYFRFINWSHRLQGQSFEQYLAERPSRVRNTIARKRRKLQREHGYEIRLYTDNDLKQAVADYNTIYKASWKTGERFTSFVPALVSTMARPGWLRFAILYIDDQPAAGQIWFVVHSKASIFRLAYDETWQRYSPGSILTAYLMEHVIDTDKVESIDFLTGNEHYKQDWMSERRERWRLVFVNKHESKPRAKPLTRLLEWLKG
ncbi:MAG TPA: GNAT family N-acetyltransferase [Gammaproteobacteria bacterium]|nr:GNAT family N-acetyltransferase [Gammaproteobacteria bacterium]